MDIENIKLKKKQKLLEKNTLNNIIKHIKKKLHS